MRNRWINALVALLLATLVVAPSGAQERFVEGTHYFALKEWQATQTGDNVEVLEVFNYACPHCGHLDPVIETWAKDKPKQAQLRYLPAVWQKPAWPEYAAVYFTAEKLGIADKSHHALMDLMYVQNKAPKDLNEIAQFFTQFGVTAEQFTTTFSSPEIGEKMKTAAQAIGNYEVEGTPTLIVDGRWRFDVTSAGAPENVGPLINFLVTRALNERQSGKAK
jgi:protein dithiol oxidoreductase (disulfide-forming)